MALGHAIESSVQSLHLITGSSLGATALLVYEFLITFEHEVEYIWTKPNTAMTKWLYLFIRYFSLIAQMSMQVMIRVDTIPSDSSSMRLRHCRGHLIWPLVATQCLLSAIELVLVWRVQALYPGRPLYAILGAFVFAEMLILGVDAGIIIPTVHYSSVCEVDAPMAPIAAYGALALSSQSVILAMCIRKRMELGWNNAPVVTLVMRDGALAYAAIFALQIIAMVSFTTGRFGYVQYWLFSVLAAVGCRIILNLQRVKIPECDATQEPTGWHELNTRITDFSGHQHTMLEYEHLNATTFHA